MYNMLNNINMSKQVFFNYQQLKDMKGPSSSYVKSSSTMDVFDDPLSLSAEEIININSKKKELLDLIMKGNNPLPKEGDIVTGKIIYNQAGVSAGVEGGFKSTIEVLSKGKDAAILKELEYGDTVSVSITEITENPFAIYGSISTANSIAKNEDMQNHIQQQIPIEGTIVEYIGHGLHMTAELDGENINIFIPSALIGMTNDPKSLVNTEATVILQSYNPATGNFVGSRKHYLETLASLEIDKLEKYPTVYTGVVTGVGKSSSGQYFGVFVQFNNYLSGMIHKANINPDWADKLDQIEKGQEIDFYVKDIVDNRIILTQNIKKSLWDTLKEGDQLTGRVKRVVTNGIFVSLDDDTFGIVPNTIDTTSLNTNFNSKVRVIVTKIDRLKRNILLDLI